MKVLSIVSGSKPAKKGEFVQLATTPGSVKLSPDFCLKMGIALKDSCQLGIGEFDASDNLGFEGKAYFIQKAGADENQVTKFGTKSGSFIQGSAANAWQDLRSEAYAGRDADASEAVTYNVAYVDNNGTQVAVLIEPSFRVSARGENEEEEEETPAALPLPTQEVAEGADEVVEEVN